MNTTTTPDDKTTALIKLIADAIIDAVNQAGHVGVPGGSIYAAMMQYGMTLSAFERFMGTLVEIGEIKKRGHLYFRK